MNFDEDSIILETYNRLKTIYSNKFDSLTAVKTVINHRNYWKPSKVKTMLLAESHVYTPDDELSQILNYPKSEEFADIPDQFVRLVYCLGYGESILAPSINDNPGTWQYWKIFAACASDKPDPEFSKVLKYGAAYEERLINKINLLKTLREKGIWLVDSCIVGLYDSGERTVNNKEMQKIIPYCFDNYISKLIEREKPEYIIIIGKGVELCIGTRIKSTAIKYCTIPQPRMRNYNYDSALLLLQQICNR